MFGPRFPTHDVELPGGRLRIAEAGRADGPPLVLLHGLSSSHECWVRALPFLDEGARVLAPDLPGFGSSDAVGEGYDAERVADAVAEALARVGAGRFVLVGHSLGGLVATVLADRCPERVSALVLVDAAGVDGRSHPRLPLVGDVADRGMRLRRRHGPGLAARRRGRVLMFGGVVADAAALPAADARLMIDCSRGATRTGQALSMAMAADVRFRLTRVAAPVGAVWGAEDGLIGPAAVEELRRLRPGLPVRLVEHAGHVPMIERPAPFAAALAGVLQALAQEK